MTLTSDEVEQSTPGIRLPAPKISDGQEGPASARSGLWRKEVELLRTYELDICRRFRIHLKASEREEKVRSNQ